MRLIDADDFKENFDEECPSDCGCCSPIEVHKDGHHKIYCYLIDEQPTAYDLDAVIAELEKGLQNAKIHKEKHSYSDEFINGYIRGREDALDVVKKGIKNVENKHD